MPAERIHVLIVSGTIGAGKTSVMEAVGDLLAERDLPSAMIDLDWLGQVHPPPPDDPVLNRLIADNLASMWPNLELLGVRYLVAARLIRSASIWDGYRATIPEARWTLARVIAPADAIERRLLARHALDVSPAILERHLIRSTQVTRDLDERLIEDFSVVNEGSLRAVADEILKRWDLPAESDTP